MRTRYPLSRTLRTSLLACAAALPVLAHDFWIEPASYRAGKDDLVELHVMVGVAWKGDENPRLPLHIQRFVAIGPKGERPVPGIDNKPPAGLLRPREAGLQVVAYQSNPSSIELAAEKFESYLKEEGLEKVLEARAKNGESQKSARELYQRCAKTLVRFGDGPAQSYDEPVGLKLELVPKSDPHGMRRDGELAVQLLYDGKPIAGVLVMALPRAKPDDVQKLRSDEAGMLTFKHVESGAWLIKAVHMEPAADPQKADWESYWASLTFEAAATGEPPR